MKRRAFMAGAGALAAAGLAANTASAQTSAARPRLVIAGAGAAGLALAARLRRQMENATVVLIDAKKAHHFQPGFMLVGAGLWRSSDVTEANADYVPRGVEWIEQAVAEFNPDANTVVTTSGQRVPYDFLFVAMGLKLDYQAIQGMDPALSGKGGIASIYAGPAEAEASAAAIDRFLETGGVGLFGRPAGEMKCAGAPLKVTFIVDDKARRRRVGRSGQSDAAPSAVCKRFRRWRCGRCPARQDGREREMSGARCPGARSRRVDMPLSATACHSGVILPLRRTL